MEKRTEQEKQIIRGNDELRIGFSEGVDVLLAELERVAEELDIDPDELLEVLYRRRAGGYDEALENMLDEDDDE
ncbi:hypothetical protein A3A84_03285 [Candidatus Collierbacteria bacterium RIFCSPLOWO2_01_FULL_50_23]|uniref:Uncharacterized protein n=2 Tax=Candidatus Collieribacteriota TaxID=1752725 RepID=A0A1F5ETD4_9BACT|nr:MAG: hypothetical protein A3D09_00475 [Candidatus Collierbacteria bacterium RIFCSPHIGHO2_02_FULL_49_10]OGD72291.1 MAG: hypothetical protein A2703_01045 [Candidatus Collierbacteria bacterium RIFCSPHIGHO2_01_FULL_50_25]OGD75038.1 MAG: hypothetical protein A3A84_03285 [Candidatus Collierbacteria bacterium RIFCSPLOWO2_01_FULL_50_23]